MPPSPIHIAAATNPTDLAAVAALFWEYAASLDIDLAPQGFAAELESLPGLYAPPGGALLLAKRSDTVLGCIALKPLAPPQVAEVKRLYVRPQARGLGVGKALVESVVAAAARLGYDEAKLDTLPQMQAAIGLYRAAGFSPIAPYGSHAYPGLLCLGLMLHGARLPDAAD